MSGLAVAHLFKAASPACRARAPGYARSRRPASLTARGLPIAALFATLAAVGLGCDVDGGEDHPKRGAPCAGARDCDGLSCAAHGDAEAEPEDLALLPLWCAERGPGGGPGARCETEDDCALGVCVLAGTCAAPCADAGDCGSDERCQEVFARRGPDALQPLFACVARVSLPAAIEVESELIADALPEGAIELELPAVDPALTTLYVLEREDDPWPETTRCRPGLCVTALHTREQPARTLFDAALDYAQGAPDNPVATGSHVSPAIVALPSGRADALSEAGYVVGLESEAAGDLRLTRIASEPGGLQLDLNVFYVGGLDLRPEGSRGPPLLENALEVVDDILGQADIFIGEVRQIAVVGALPARGTLFPLGDAQQGFEHLRLRFGVLAELPGLFRLSAGAGNGAVNLFFVRDIEGRASGDLHGEAGGIPGPPGMHGTAGSGIAIATDMMAGDPEGLGRTLAHELAHYLGLFHTSEADGSVREGLPDTAECRADRDVDGDGLTRADCSGFGADNLMFWASSGGRMLSPAQRAVLRASPLLH